MTSRRSSPLTRQDLVARGEPGARGRGAGRDSNDSCGGHARQSTGPAPRTRLGRGTLGSRCRVEKVLLAEPRGFCAGVEMAIKALAWMVRAFEPPVYCYHEIVHNRLVVDRFREQGVVFVDDVDEVPAGRAAHALGPRLGARGGRRGPRRRPLRRERGVPARHQGPPRGARCGRGKGFTILYVGHAGHDEASARSRSRPRRSASSSTRTTSTRVLAEVDDPTQGRAARPDDARPRTTGPGIARPDPRRSSRELWTATRNDLCFATTNRQAALTRDREPRPTPSS